MNYNLDGKRFVTVSNVEGLSGSETLFDYHQTDNLVTGTYRGGEIREGSFVGKMMEGHNECCEG